MPVAAVVAKSAVTERTYVPQEQEIVDEIMKTRQTAPDIGIKSLYRKIRDQKTVYPSVIDMSFNNDFS